jgi:signal transduction histidine kinase
MLALATLVHADEAPLTTAAAVRSLPVQEAGAGKPVHLRGVVTYVAPNGVIFFVQDDTGGVSVRGQREKPNRPDLKAGAIVELEGVTAPGKAVPLVTSRKKDPIRLNIVGEAPLPAPQPATIAQLALARNQDVRVEVAGVVRAVETEPFGGTAQETLLITLADGHDRLTVAMPGWRNPTGLPQHLIGATVRVLGVFNATPFERQPTLTNRLFISALKDVQVDQPATPPFKEQAETVAAVRELSHEDLESSRRRITGLVTVVEPEKGMFVEDASGGIWADASATATVGDTVDVTGFPAAHDGSPVLEDSVWRAAAEKLHLTPPIVTATGALTGELDGRLVQIEALLLGVSSAGEGPTLVLQSAERVFLARCGNSKLRMPSLGENSWLRVTGVCVNSRPPQLRNTSATQPLSFHLLISGPQAIEIARTPSWWTLQRIIMVVGGLAALALASVVWATTLRRRVTMQTDQIREHLAREAVAEERLRIARELHDSVQQDLLGITMQLKATDRLLDTEPAKARTALTLASAMARRSQAETHRAVWDLREAADKHSDLVTSLNDMVAGLNTDDSAKVEVHSTGERRVLPQTVESHVLRVAQEAVTNSLKHGEARRIDLELHFNDDRLTLKIRDDGKGFDAEHAPSAQTGHFGLFGMKERAIKLQGDIRITSRPGEGTSVQLDVPIPAETGGNESLHSATSLRLIPKPSTS